MASPPSVKNATVPVSCTDCGSVIAVPQGRTRFAVSTGCTGRAPSSHKPLVTHELGGESGLTVVCGPDGFLAVNGTKHTTVCGNKSRGMLVEVTCTGGSVRVTTTTGAATEADESRSDDEWTTAP
jgi:ribosomal protein S27E